MKVIYETYLRRNRNGNNNNEIGHANNSSKNMDSEITTSRANFAHIIQCDSIVINKELGVGEFGVVQQGVWTNPEGKRIQVAIKCLSTTRLENNRQEFLKEAVIMHSISHDHIVALYGIVLEPSIMLVTELAPLRSLLECLKEPTLISHFPVTSLCGFAAQIADGMSYLESKRLIHRDLAARNILVFNKNIVKISDFGLSRALGVGKDYYQSNFNVNLKLPIAWCAPECINYLKFTSQSDVWAYGVTLWEMFSFSFQPWAALTGQQILEAIDKPNFQRLEQPECCPKEYYQLMLKCWTHEPHLRPKFADIINLLPECKPELLQAIRNKNNCSKEFLPYRTGDIITVIDKSEVTDPTFESCWKGVNNERKTGYFNPSDFVAYLGLNLPSSSNTNQCPSSTASSSFVQQFFSGSNVSQSNGNSNGNHSHSFASTITSTVLQSSKFIRGFLESKSNHYSNNSSPHGTRKSRLRPEMISKPQGDFKHTGHVGADGIFFGDVSFLEGKYHRLPKNSSTCSSLENNGENKSRNLPAISKPIGSYGRNNSFCFEGKTNVNEYNDDAHEYHEISEDDDMGPLESPPFEVLDFGPSLMEEVFRELDHIKPDLNNETGESETAINENGINVKNEVRELNLKISKDVNNFRKKQSSVKHISEAEQNELDSAIAMAKDIANRTMLEDELDMTKNDSPKTPNSPNKRKFSFKFPTHKPSPKSERRTFSEETESIGNIIESITPAAKEAYLSLVEKGVSTTVSSSSSSSTLPKKDHYGDKRPDVKPPPPPTANVQTSNISVPVVTSVGGQFNLPSCSTNTSTSVSNSLSEMDNNPLRMLRTAGIGKVMQSKVRGNRSFSQPRLPTTAQTAGLARVASSRSQLGSPPPVPNVDEQSMLKVQSQNISNGLCMNNALPLPPRDRSRPLMQLKTHQRRHPLVIPAEMTRTSDSNGYGSVVGDEFADGNHGDSPPFLHRHVPVLKQVSCPQAPAAFLMNVYNKASTNTGNANSNECDRISAPLQLQMPNRSYLSDDLTESLESEMQKAFDNIKLNQATSLDEENGDSVVSEAVPMQPKLEPNESTSKSEPVSSITLSNTLNTQPSTLNGSNYINNQYSSNNNQNNEQDKDPANSNSLIAQSTKRGVDCDEVRVMQKVLGNEANISDEECAQILSATEWDIHKAIKCVRLRQQLRSHNITVECNWAQMLAKFNWNIRHASNYLIATQGVPEDTTEV